VWAGLLAAAVLLLSRLLFLPPTLEDIDSTNFARALDQYDPTRHQPHPPGYPVYVAFAKIAGALAPTPAAALASTSAVAQTLLAIPLLALFRRLSATPERAWAATALTLTNPVLWFNGARPMSDSVGLLFVIGTQALLLASLSGGRALLAASFLLGLAPGARLQSLFLTVPLWVLALARNPGRRLAAIAAAAFGMVLWIVPLLIAAGGPSRYMASFSDTIGQAIAFEPLVSGFTLNRGARAAALVLLGPWASPVFGSVALGLATIGFAAAAARHAGRLGMALLAFGPYLLAHLFLQHVETNRYSLPYVPLLALLAAEGIAAVADRARGFGRAVQWTLTGACAAWSAALTLPALAAYSRTPSPTRLALEEVRRAASPPERFLLASHFIFGPHIDVFLQERPPSLERSTSAPGKELPRLVEYWRSGGDKDVLFVADPTRTDLLSIAPRAQRVVGSWRWPFRNDWFLAGARPNRAELVRISRPGWLAGEGWLLSLEAGRIAELPRVRERRAHLSASAEPAYLLVSGEATGPASQYTLDLELDGAPLASHGCGEPLLAGFVVPPAQAPAGYRDLLARTRRGDAQEGAPYALRGLDYGPRGEAGFAHGSGWFYPEKDEEARPFHWTSAKARSILHVPERGAKLVVEGTAPLEYVGAGVNVSLAVDGTPASTATLQDRGFRLEARLAPALQSFREVTLATDRTFVPDRVQRNGDRRRLGLRVYGFRLE
jgi:hypothetical protein